MAGKLKVAELRERGSGYVGYEDPHAWREVAQVAARVKIVSGV